MASTKAKSLEQIAKETGGTIKGDRVEYKVSGVKDGRKFKATRYAYANEKPNFKAPVASDVYKSDKGVDNYTGPILSENLAPAPSINFPTPPAPSNLGTQAITSIGGQAGGGAITTPTPVAGPTPAESLKELISSMQKPVDSEKIYKRTENDVQLQEKQATVNNFQNQLNAITAKANADKLALEGTGRGVTDVIIGGQQAKIDREAAIQALPIAAQLSAAQGDLASARDHMDTLFKIRLQDAQAKVDYKNKIAELVYNFASEEQKKALEEKRTQDERNFTLMRDNISYARDLAATALANGQPSLAASFMKLDFNSPSIENDLGNLASGLTVTPKTTGGGVGSAGFKNADIESSVRQDAVALLADVEAGTTTVEKVYTKLRTLYSPLEASDDAIKGLLGIGQASTSTEQPVSDQEAQQLQSLETDIQRLKDSGQNFSNDYIRAILTSRYGSKLVNKSSIASFTDQLQEFLGLK